MEGPVQTSDDFAGSLTHCITGGWAGNWTLVIPPVRTHHLCAQTWAGRADKGREVPALRDDESPWGTSLKYSSLWPLQVNVA